ncbi:MAG: phosphatidate cytidylyltransferase [Ktedonobacteraceae bacterium]|nr:phosphatidate cytidylyltransferase [Ktedonobacteraceae bacterium]
MTQGDLLGLVFSYVYAFSLLLLIEAVRRWRNYPTDFTRKFVHIGAGMWIWGILLLFDHWWLAIIPTATFILFNAIFLRYHIFSAMDPKEGATPGTVYFAFSCTLLLFLFHEGWDQQTGSLRGYEYLAMSGIMAMTWGDAFSAIIGKRFGKHTYQIIKNRKLSIEGSIAGFVFTFAAVAITLHIMTPISLSLVLIGGLAAAIIATALEAVSPAGTDNLSVPIGVALLLFLLGI